MYSALPREQISDIVNEIQIGTCAESESKMSFRCIPAIASATLLASCGTNQPEMPYGTAQQLMANEVQPTAEIYWQSVGAVSELVDGEPVFREWQPETDEEWAEVQAATQRLQELGEILKSPAYSDGRGEDWTDYSNGLIEAAKLAEQTVIDRDAEAILNKTGYTIYSVCQACHQMYPPENEEEAGVRPGDESSLDE